MKKIDLIKMSLCALSLGMTTHVSAQADDVQVLVDDATKTVVEEIDWSEANKALSAIVSDASNTHKIYLYSTQQKKFITVGGTYGAQPILAEMGMNFYIDKVSAVASGDSENATTENATTEEDCYYIHSWVDNPVTGTDSNGDYLGAKPVLADDERIYPNDGNDETHKYIRIYIDRGINNSQTEKQNASVNTVEPTGDDTNTTITYDGQNRIKWYIVPVEGKTNGYRIYSKWKDNNNHGDDTERMYYLCYYQGSDAETPQKKFMAVTTDVNQADEFYFIQNDDYLTVINKQNKKYINVSGLIQDARFERNNKGVKVANKNWDYPLDGNYDGEGQKDNVWKIRYNRNIDTYLYPCNPQQSNLDDLAYQVAWVGPNGDFDGKIGNYIFQKIEGLKPGLYRIHCQGFYYNKDDANATNTSYLFASQEIDDLSNQISLKKISEEDKQKMLSYTYMNNSAYENSNNKGYSDEASYRALNAGKIFANLNPYEDKDVDSRAYDNSVAVVVRADEGKETGTLYFGAGKKNDASGFAFFDNFQLFYLGDREGLLDAANSMSDRFNVPFAKADGETHSGVTGLMYNDTREGYETYQYPVTYNIRRYFNTGTWESLILPINMTGDQVKQTFGGDKQVKLSKLEKIAGTCMYFKAVDTDKEGIEAGQPYIIKVLKEADIAGKKGDTPADTYKFPWGNNTWIQVNGPIYQAKGVIPPVFNPTADNQNQTDQAVVTPVNQTTGSNKEFTVQIKGYYYDPGAAPANSYVITNGTMYHLKSEWKSFVGTSWYITCTENTNQGSKPAKLTFDFGDDDSTITAIEGVVLDGQQTDDINDGYVYNLNGQRVGKADDLQNLQPGIYILNKKKYYIK